MSEEAAALIISLRKHVMDRSGPAKDDDGNLVLPNGAWAMMLKAADMLERQAAQISALRVEQEGKGRSGVTKYAIKLTKPPRASFDGKYIHNAQVKYIAECKDAGYCGGEVTVSSPEERYGKTSLLVFQRGKDAQEYIDREIANANSRWLSTPWYTEGWTPHIVPVEEVYEVVPRGFKEKNDE